MIISLVAIAILGVCLIGLGVVIGRKFPILARFNATSPTSTVEARKKSLVEERLRRKFTASWARFKKYTGPVGEQTTKLWDRTHKKLVDLEHEYKVRSLPVFLNRRHRRQIDHEITDMLVQARALLDDGEAAAAEEKCMQAIRLEPRSVPAFEFLGQLYLQTKEFGHAKEVYHYLLKLTGDREAVYHHGQTSETGSLVLTTTPPEADHVIASYRLELSTIYRQLGDTHAAFDSAQEAARLEPNSPKVLDALICASVSAGKKQFAEDALTKLIEVNPQNSKIAEWRDQIATMPSRPIATPENDTALDPTLYEAHTAPNDRS